MLALSESRDSNGLRPLDVRRDLGSVIELIEEAFRGKLSPEGEEAIRELKTLKYLGSFLWLISRISPELCDILSGYVWVEGGAIVGNVTLSVADEDPGRWTISNVAVRPDYRGRGIARELIQAPIRSARERGGDLVTLQVRADNLPAQNLYRSLGFTKLDATTELRLKRIGEVVFCPVRGFELAKVKPSEWRKIYELVNAATPPKARRLKPVREDDFKVGLSHRLANWFTDLVHLRDVHKLAVEGDEGFAALLTVQAMRLRPPHRIELIVHPDYHGLLEEMLVTKALSILRHYPLYEAIAHIRLPHPEAVSALRQYGFVEVETIDRLGLALRQEIA